MKLNLDEALPAGARYTFTAAQASEAPEYARRLLAIPGVKSVFHTADFIALDRLPKGDWQAILHAAREVLGEAEGGSGANPSAAAAGSGTGVQADSAFGEVTVLLQTFRGIPLQVRARAGGQEARISMPERFTAAAVEAGKAAPNLIMERVLEEIGVRYGELQEVLQDIVQELDATYPEERVRQLVAASYAAPLADASGAKADKGSPAGGGPQSEAASANAPSTAGAPTDSPAPGAAANTAPGAAAAPAEELAARLRAPDWKMRYAALQRLAPSLETLPLLAGLLGDDNASVRRLAVVYIGDIREPEALPHLFRALHDQSPAVRRTAGDTLSDIGDPAAIPAMIETLRDANKLVRWRAARFLYEVGDASAVSALRDIADNEPEFEIRMQASLALERIEGGHAAEGSVWQQMTRRNEQADR
jgi:hypothetical protein